MEQEIEWLLRDKYTGQKTSEFYSDIERLKQGEPLAFVIGWIPFLSAKIYLDSKPLIPRTETEYWVGEVIKKVKNNNIPQPKVLDLCAGSGCIGIAVLKEIPHSRVDFAEIDDSHHATIIRNIKENYINKTRCAIFGGNLFENIINTYDLILTNPPYIDPEKSERIQKSALHYEPSQALFGGKNGMELIEMIIQLGPKYLNTGGVLYIEHEPEQVAHILTLAPHAQFHKDQFGTIRYCQITK